MDVVSVYVHTHVHIGLSKQAILLLNRLFDVYYKWGVYLLKASIKNVQIS